MVNKSLKWNFIYQYGYTITNIINGIVLLPFYIKYIPADVLGIWWATGNLLAWLTMTDPGVGDILQQRIAHHFGKGNWAEINKIKGSGIIIGGIVTASALIIGVVLFAFLDDILKQPVFRYHDLVWACIISIISTAASLFSFVLVGINQGLQRSKTVALSYVSGNIIYFVSNILLLVVWNTGVLSIAYAGLIRVAWIIAFNRIHRSTAFSGETVSYDWSYTRKFGKIFLYTASSRILAVFANNLDLIFVARMLPASFITLFEINRRPIKMLQGLVGRYSVALMPSISHDIGKMNALQLQKSIERHFLKYFTAVVIFTGGLIVFGPYALELWVGKSQFLGYSIWSYLSLTCFFWLIGYFFSNMMFAAGDIKVNSKISTIRSFSYLVAVWIGLRLDGLRGLVIAQLINTLLIDFAIYTYRAIRIKHIQFRLVASSVIASLLFFILIAALTLIRIHYWESFNYTGALVLVLSFSIITIITYLAQKKYSTYNETVLFPR